jgi:hypothetical protein
VPLHEPCETFQQLERVLSREGINDFLRFTEPLQTQENETHVHQRLTMLDESVEKGDQTLQVAFKLVLRPLLGYQISKSHGKLPAQWLKVLIVELYYSE